MASTRHRTRLATSAAALLLAHPALAAQLSAGFVASVSIQSSCAVTATGLNFGNVGVISGGETATASVSVNCASGVPYALSFSATSIVTAFAGQMVNGANHVSYSAALAGPNAGVGSHVHTITGLLPAQPTPPSAIYVDNRTIYLNY